VGFRPIADPRRGGGLSAAGGTLGAASLGDAFPVSLFWAGGDGALTVQDDAGSVLWIFSVGVMSTSGLDLPQPIVRVIAAPGNLQQSARNQRMELYFLNIK
jgi:hypothetical protein